ncbi:hypothetical protein NQ318_003913, partial [Aromia moschata]
MPKKGRKRLTQPKGTNFRGQRTRKSATQVLQGTTDAPPSPALSIQSVQPDEDATALTVSPARDTPARDIGTGIVKPGQKRKQYSPHENADEEVPSKRIQTTDITSAVFTATIDTVGTKNPSSHPLTDAPKAGDNEIDTIRHQTDDIEIAAGPSTVRTSPAQLLFIRRPSLDDSSDEDVGPRPQPILMTAATIHDDGAAHQLIATQVHEDGIILRSGGLLSSDRPEVAHTCENENLI